MTFKEKIRIVVSHMFSKKALGYRAFTVSWTMLAVLFWNYLTFGKIVFFESLEITLTIVVGKFIFYGIWEFFHLEKTGRLCDCNPPEAPPDEVTVDELYS